jgi:hypothetical protein
MSAGGGGERPMEAVELLRDCSGEGMWPSLLFVLLWSAMIEGCTKVRGDGGDASGVCGSCDSVCYSMGAAR